MRGDEDAVLARVDHLGNATNVTGDYWPVRCKCFDDRQPLRLAIARHNHHICGGEDLRHIFTAPQEVHAIAADFGTQVRGGEALKAITL